MTGIVLLMGQLGIVVGGFLGMSSIMNWYHIKEDKVTDKKDKGEGKNGNPFNKA